MWGPGLRAELKRIWGLDPLEATPGVGDRLCGQREEETSPRAYQRRPPRPTGAERVKGASGGWGGGVGTTPIPIKTER